ncbi:MAG TPA: hypothetical protein PLV45_06915 [bacterium]|nr:hypothetical protein [bacterium]
MWMESILLRSSPEGQNSALDFLSEWLQETPMDDQIDTINLMKRVPDCGDLLVEIRWISNDAPQKSHTGYMISQFLERYGSIHHTIWVLKRSKLNVQTNHLNTT